MGIHCDCNDYVITDQLPKTIIKVKVDSVFLPFAFLNNP
jgi:hypothetical protein